ncbi:MAG: hypothetical protein GXO75_14620, partial [Calditrichaeota bacterium]|nr:hypothetical protein [Calditrichota bacterium]
MPDSTAVSIINPTLLEWVKLIGGIGVALAGFTSVLVVFFTQFLPWYRDRRNKRSLQKRVGAELYDAGVLYQATRHYIDPDCQSLDPSGGEDQRHVVNPRGNVFKLLYDYLYHPTEYRYLIILADSGMGKTSLLLNYYVRNLRRRRKRL